MAIPLVPYFVTTMGMFPLVLCYQKYRWTTACKNKVFYTQFIIFCFWEHIFRLLSTITDFIQQSQDPTCVLLPRCNKHRDIIELIRFPRLPRSALALPDHVGSNGYSILE